MSKKMYSFRLPENHPQRRKVGIDFTGRTSLTQQDHASECDINVLVDRYLKAGMEFPSADNYHNVIGLNDFQELADRYNSGKAAFATLPAKVRRYYNEDAAAFLKALNDPKEHTYLEHMGLLKKKTQETTVSGSKGEAASPTGAPPKAGGVSPSS